jgi:hypothetical protein
MYNFVTKELNGDLSSSEYHLIPALRQNVGCHKLKGDREEETVVTGLLKTEDTELH